MRAFERATGNVAVDETLAPKNTVRGWQLDAVRLHMDGAGGAVENLTVTIISAAGAVYNVVLHTVAMAAAADVNYHPEQPIYLDNGDGIRVEYANTNGRTWGLEFAYSVH